MKKITELSGDMEFPGLKNLLRIMKLTTFFILISVVCVFASETYSQSKKLNLNMKNVTVKEVLSAIENQSEFRFMYSRKVIDVNREVAIKEENSKIEDALKSLFAGTDVEYTIKDRIIVLSSSALINSEQASSQQQKSVSGKITDSSGASLPGVSVVVKGTTNGTISDTNGNFTLSNVPENATLQFSFVGMKTQEITVGSKTTIDVILEDESIGLEEVVAVGYGTQRKGNLTGSISSVKSEKLTIAPVASVANSMVGQLPGLVAKQTSGQPGADAANMSIRGFGNALVLVDGVESSYNNIDANQIETISILKDGAASIYGARAGNGVILITTKRGNNQKPIISVNSSYSLQGVTSMMQPTDAVQLATIQREVHLQQGKPENLAPWTLEQIQKFKDGTDPLYPNTKWYDVVFRDWAPQQQHNISVRGGSEKIKYYGFVGYLDQETMIKTGGGGYGRYNIQSNIDAKITNDLTMRFDFSGAYEKRKFPIRGLQTGGPAWQDLYTSRPFWPATLPDPEKLSYAGADIGNVYASTNMDLSGYTASDKKDLKATLSLDYNIRWIKGLSAKALVNYSEFNSFEKRFQKPLTFYSYDPASAVYTQRVQFFQKAELNQWYDVSPRVLQNYSLNYENVFKDHRVTALALYESINYWNDNFTAGRKDFLTPAIDQLFAGSTVNATNNGSASQMGRKSLIGRANYSYKNKYLAEAIFRADASAKFPSNSRWGYFPSISLGWVMSEESFMKSIGSLDNLKLRASYGQSGNDAVGNFQYLAGYQYADLYVINGISQQGLSSKGIANPLLTWERMNISNAGFDYSFFKRKIYGELDVFYRERTGIPATRATSLPSTFGASLPQENLNSINDRGFEFSVGTTGKFGELTYDVSANISWSRSKWGHYEEPVYTDPDQERIYKRSGQWTDRTFGYLTDGLFTSQEEITALPYNQDLKGNTSLRPGDVKYLDLNDDKKIDWKDQVVVGKSTTPHWMMGSSISLKYKNFDLSALLQGAFGYTTNTNIRGGYGSIFSSRVFETRWTEENNNKYALVPRIGGSGANRNTSDFYYKDAFYLRLKTFAIGYSLPKQWLSAAGIEQFRVFASGTNMLTYNKLKEYEVDPEAPMDVDALRYYPQQRVISLGVNLSF